MLSVNLGLGALAAWASVANYPGGEAITTLVAARQCKSKPIYPHFLVLLASRLACKLSSLPRTLSTLADARPRALPAVPLSIHISPHAAMTGASRLLHGYEPSASRFPFLPAAHDERGKHTTWTYDKTESLSGPAGDYDHFDLLLTGEPEQHGHSHNVIKVFGEFDGFGLNWGWGEDVGEGWARQWLPVVRKERGGVVIMGRNGKQCSSNRYLKEH